MKNSFIDASDSSIVIVKENDETNVLVATDKSCRAFSELEEKVEQVLETYSNVHRGSGHFSVTTTALYEYAREIVLKYFGVDKRKYTIIFCSVHGAEILKRLLHRKDFKMVSSADIDLPLGVRAFALRKSDQPKGIPFQVGGSTARMVSPNYVIWSAAPQRFEAGTPLIVNSIAFALALDLVRQYGKHCFTTKVSDPLPAEEILEKDELSGFSGVNLMSELRKLKIGGKLKVPALNGQVPFVNFDHAASTPAFYPVWETVKKVWRSPVKTQHDIIDATTNLIRNFLGADRNYEVLYTSNTTEALNIAARLVNVRFGDDTEPVILNTSLEHNANELPWRYIPGVSLERLPVDNNGFINHSLLEETLRHYNSEGRHDNKRIRLLAVSGASNVLGTLNDMAAISRIAHKFGVPVLVDGAQMVAHHQVRLSEWGIDYFAFSGHKIYAPFGSGALVVRKDHLSANRQEFLKYKAEGEENLIGIAAIGKAVNLLQRIGIMVIEEYERILTKRMLTGLSGISILKVHGISDPDSPDINAKGSIISFNLKNGKHQQLAGFLAARGAIGLRYGCFCSHMLVKDLLGVKPPLAIFQNVLFTLAPGISDLVPGLMRVSFGFENEEEEIDLFISLLKNYAHSPSSANPKVAQKFCKLRLNRITGKAES